MKFLILDAEILIGKSLTLTLRMFDFDVVGPFTRPEPALTAIDENTPDAAFLDINLGPAGTSFDVALALQKREIPFVFVTGYEERSSFRNRFPDARYLSKPATLEAIRQMANELIDCIPARSAAQSADID